MKNKRYVYYAFITFSIMYIFAGISCNKSKSNNNVVEKYDMTDNAVYHIEYNCINDIIENSVDYPCNLIIEYWDEDCMDYEYLTQCGVHCGDEQDPYVKIIISNADEKLFMEDYNKHNLDNWYFSYLMDGYYWLHAN